MDLNKKLDFVCAEEFEHTVIDFICGHGLWSVGDCFAESRIIIVATEEGAPAAKEGCDLGLILKHPSDALVPKLNAWEAFEVTSLKVLN